MKTGRPDDLGKAIDAYRQAVDRYPDNATYRAKLALALLAAGRAAEFRSQAESAVRV